MPSISRFFGIEISMFFNEHGRPHFHADYAEHSASFAIDTLEVLQGALPSRQLRLVRRWAALHRDELLTNWNRARSGLPLTAIAPLT